MKVKRQKVPESDEYRGIRAPCETTAHPFALYLLPFPLPPPILLPTMLRKSSSLIALVVAVAGCTTPSHPAPATQPSAAAAPATRPTPVPVATNSKEQRLFDGKTLKN